MNKHCFIAKKRHYNSTAIDRRIHNGRGVPTTGLTDAQRNTLKINNAKGLNIDDRITKFQDQLKDEFTDTLQILEKYISL